MNTVEYLENMLYDKEYDLGRCYENDGEGTELCNELENEVKMLQEAVRAVALLPQLVETLQNCSPEYKTVDGSYCIFCDADMNYGVHADNCKYVRLTKEGTK